MSIKTTKRMSLGVIASLVIAPFAVIAPASASAVTVTNPTDVVRATATTDAVIAVKNTAAIAQDADGDMVVRITSVPATADATTFEVGDQFTAADPAAGAGGLAAAASTNVTVGAAGDYFNVAGTYGYLAYWDPDGDGVIDAGETTTAGTITVGGAPTALTVTAKADTLGNSGASLVAVNATYSVALTDAGGRTTKLVAAETVILGMTQTAGSGNITLAGSAGASPRSGTLTAASTLTSDKYDFTVQAAAVSTSTISANFGGSLSPLATAATATYTSVTEGYTTGIAVQTGETDVTTTANAAYAFPAANTGDGDLTDNDVVNSTIYANLTNLSIPFTISGTAGTAVRVVVAAGGTGLPTGVTAVTGHAVIGSAGTATVTITATAATQGQDYVITVYQDAADGTSYTVEYETASVQDATVTWSPNVEATNLTTILALAGSTRSYTVTVADEFGKKYSNYIVQAVSTGSNAATTQAITDANGNATVTHVDAKAGAANDTLNWNVFAPSDLATDLEDKSLTVEYTTQAAYSLGLTLGLTTDEALYTETVTVANHVSVTPALASTAVGLAAKTGVMLTYTATGGAKLVAADSTDTLATTTLTAASNTAVYAYGTTAGTATITVTSELGHSVAKTFAVTVDATKARLVTVTGGTAEWGSDTAPAKVTATVTDGWGNKLTGVTVNFSRTAASVAGRFAFGGSTTTCLTDATGTCFVDVVGTQGESGAFVAAVSLATGTYAEYDDAAGSTVKRFAAGSGAVANPTGTVTGTPYVAPVVYDKPSLSFAKSGSRIILSGTAVDGEGDIIIYVKSVGSTTWVEKAKTLEVAAPGDFNGSIRGFKTDKVIRVKQEGTGLFSNQIIVKANR